MAVVAAAYEDAAAADVAVVASVVAYTDTFASCLWYCTLAPRTDFVVGVNDVALVVASVVDSVAVFREGGCRCTTVC